MHAVDLIALKDGHWAAHCEQVQTGSVAASRAEAIQAIQEIIQNPDEAPRHPNFHDRSEKLYPLSAPGHYSFRAG